MSGIFPDVNAGGVVIRDANGACLAPAGVQQAYCPPAEFQTTCQITALPTDCTARFTAAQVNAFQSEMLALGHAFDADGVWNCASVQNLASLFNTWWTANKGKGDNSTITTNSPFAIIPGGVVNAICANNAAGDALATCLISTQPGNNLIAGGDGRLYATSGPAPQGNDVTITAAAPFATIPLGVAQQIVADNAAGDALAFGLISTQGGNALAAGSDGRLYIPAGGVPTADFTEFQAKAPLGDYINIQTISTFYKASVSNRYTAWGYNAGAGMSAETAIGYQAGAANTAANLTAVGRDAANTNTGADVVGIGVNAANGNTGTRLAAVGTQAGQNMAGSECVAIGYLSMNANTGDFVTGVGASAGRNNIGVNCVAMGRSALFGNQMNNTCGVGNFSLEGNTGSDCTAMGNQAGRTNTGIYCVFIGSQSGQTNTGGYSTGIGRGSLASNTGAQATGLGYFAGQANIGARATSVGFAAGTANAGADATVVGTQSGVTNQGAFLTAIGSGAGSRNRGVNNSFVGINSGLDATGDENTFIGAESGNANTLGGAQAVSGFTSTNLVITAHGYGAPGTLVTLAFTGGTPPAPLALGDKQLFTVVDVNTVQLMSPLVTFTNAGTAATVQKVTVTVRANSTAIGYNAEVTANNQVKLGDTRTEQVYTDGVYRTKAFTPATLSVTAPPSAAFKGGFAYCETMPAAPTAGVVYCDGVNWRKVANDVIVV